MDENKDGGETDQEDDNEDEFNVDFDLINVIEEQSPGDGEALRTDNIFDHNETLSNAS